jgi:hypothetical protein
MENVCSKIAAAIQRPRHAEYIGQWYSQYPEAGAPDHPKVVDDIEITASRGGIVITGKPSTEVHAYIAFGHIYDRRQVMGTWRHTLGKDFSEGLFVLMANTSADMMYGYCTGHDRTGALIFETWTLVKKTKDQSRRQINSLLRAAEETLRKQNSTASFGRGR